MVHDENQAKFNEVLGNVHLTGNVDLTGKVIGNMSTKMYLLGLSLEGRDKLTKLMQYACRLLAYHYGSLDAEKRLYAMFKVCQQSRKVFRLGKSSVEWKKAIKKMTEWQQFLKLIRHFGMSGYLLYDNMICLHRANVWKIDAVECGKRGGALWFAANLASLTMAYEALAKLIKDKDSWVKEKREETRKLLIERSLTAIKCTCDVLVSSNTKGVRLAERVTGKKLHDGTMGLLGTISALIALYKI